MQKVLASTKKLQTYEKVTNLQKVGAIIILISCGILLFSAEGINLSDSWVGDLLFVIGGLFFSVYVVCNPAWNLKATHVLFSGSVINAIYYVPIWYFFYRINDGSFHVF